MKNYDTVVLIGRFQPVHNAHVEILRRASEMGDNLIIIVGSSFLPRTYKNPFTFEERKFMLESELNRLRISRFQIEPCMDVHNDQAWAVKIQEIVETKTNPGGRIAVIGHDKDESTYYLKMFPQWDAINVGLIEPLHATDIRDLFFREQPNMHYLEAVVPKSVQDYLDRFKMTTQFQNVLAERRFIESYRRQYEHLPYEPVFVTTDAVVVQSGHVLMVKRKSEPGKGLLAFPGGFLNASTDRSIEDAMLRELKEETGIKVPVPVLRGSIKDSKVFDAINRSARGRTITHAYMIVLPDGELPKVKGQDDAEKAMWVPISHVNPEQCFEDHYLILQHFLGALT